MSNPTKWTEEALLLEAKKYTSRKELQEGNASAYTTILRTHNLRDIAFAHMTRPFVGKWTESAIQIEALKYTTRSDFAQYAKGAHARAISIDILDKVCSHMEVKRMKWTKEAIKEKALQYTTKEDFRLNAYPAYLKATRLDIIEDICEHMETPTRELWKVLPDVPLRTKGIYIIYLEADIIYIGKSSSCINARLRNHTKRFPYTDAVVYEIESTADINIAEVYLIAKHQPIHNLDGITGDRTSLEISNLDSIITNTITINLKEQYEKSRISIPN